MKCKVIFKTMAEQLAEMPEIAPKIQAVYEWQILQNGKVVAIYSKLLNFASFSNVLLFLQMYITVHSKLS